MKHHGLSFFCLLLATSSFAQPLIPLQTSNFAGTQGIYLNPSSIADSRLSLQINVGVGSFNFSREPIPVPLVPFGKNLFSAGKPRGVNQGDVRGPGIMARIGHRQAVAFTTRYRAGYAFSGNYNLVRWVEGNERSAPAGGQTFNFAAEGYTEYAFTYAVTALDIEKHHVKLGGTVKILRGLQTVDVSSQATIASGSTGTAQYTGASVNGRASDLAFFQGASFGQKLFGATPGRGTGFDVGIAYEFRPNQRLYRYTMDGRLRAAEEKDKYAFRIAASLLDIGQIRYNQLTSYVATSRSGTLRQADFNNKDLVRLQNQFINQFGLAGEPDVRSGEILLPKTTSVQLDAYLGRSWYANVVYQSAMPVETSAGLYRGSVVAIGPRSEGPGGEVAGTIYYYPDIQKTALGLHIKAGIFILGTDNLLGIFRDNGLAPHIYGGLAIPFMAQRPKDRDFDNVSDKRDKCPDVPGILTFAGCPDTDNDGVRDQDDACPTVAGPVATKGCPDTDLDGVLDKDDVCPKIPGLARFNGCPDTDNDGVGDDIDQCPTIVGGAELLGCPDSDNDGVRDNLDLCQSEAGLKELDGCLLRNRTSILPGTPEADANLLNQLSQAFIQGPRSIERSLALLKRYLTEQPSRKLSIELTGQKILQLRQMENQFREEMTKGGISPQQLIITTQIKEGLETGFALAWAL